METTVQDAYYNTVVGPVNWLKIGTKTIVREKNKFLEGFKISLQN